MLNSAAFGLHERIPGGARGNTLVLVMIVIAVLSLVGANLLLSANARYHTFYQSASWQEALVGSEAGVDLAMNELRNRVLNGPNGAFMPSGNWTPANQTGAGYPDNGRAFPASNQAFLIDTHTGEGNATMSARVFVDVPGSSSIPAAPACFAQSPPPTLDLFMCEQSDALGVDPQSHWWYRIRSQGIAGVSGPARANIDTRDNHLRKFSFYTDWRTGQPVTPPQVSRVVEVVAKPLTSFRNALMADVQIDLSNQDVLIDSYDSSKGPYDGQTNSGSMGNLATNGKLINAGGATVRGDAMTDNGSVNGAQNVTGQQRNDFYQELIPVQPLSGWGGVPAQPVVTGSAAFTASADRMNPTRIRLNGINLQAGGNVMSIAGPPAAGGAAPAPSYIKIYVDGDVSTASDSYVDIGPGVNAIFYVDGNINLQGSGILNESQLSGRLLINGIEPAANPDGSIPSRSINVATSQDFVGIIYAPNHDLALTETSANASQGGGLLGGLLGGVLGLLGLSEQADHAAGYNGVYGAIIARTIMVGAKTHFHYDEVLREAGPVNHYEIVNWFEDTSSLATVNW